MGDLDAAEAINNVFANVRKNVSEQIKKNPIQDDL